MSLTAVAVLVLCVAVFLLTQVVSATVIIVLTIVAAALVLFEGLGHRARA